VILRRFASFVFTAIVCSSAFAQDAKSPSTTEERHHWAEVLHKLEAQPADSATISEAGHIIIRLIEVPDFTVKMCSVMTELPESYKPRQAILQLYMLGLAGYQIETGKSDAKGSNLYALHSVLKGYAVISQQDSQAKEPSLDELVKLDSEGKLPDLVKRKNCK
jgi:hypothetical protein